MEKNGTYREKCVVRWYLERAKEKIERRSLGWKDREEKNIKRDDRYKHK